MTRLIRRRFIYIFTLTILVVSTVISFSAYALASVYNGFREYIAPYKDTLIILSKDSSTPYTGVIPLDNLGKVVKLGGVYYVSPELPIPAYVGEEAIILRGIEPRYFRESIDIEMLEGTYLDETDYRYILLGCELADRLGLEVGDTVVVRSLLKPNYIILEVKGIYRAGYPYDSEALALLDNARILRGLHGNYSSIIRVVVDPSRMTEVRREVLDILYEGEGVRGYVEEASRTLDYYLGRYGFSVEAILIPLIPPLIISIISLVYIVKSLYYSHRSIFRSLSTAGARYWDIKKYILIETTPYIVAGILIGLFLGYAILELISRIYWIGFIIKFPVVQLNPILSTTILLGLYAIIVALIIKGYMDYEE